MVRVKDKLIKKLADLADREGMTTEGVSRFPDLLKSVKLHPDQIGPSLVRAADRYNREAFEELCRKYGANKPRQRQEYMAQNVPETSGSQRRKLFGFPITAVIRWMGKEAWSVDEALEVMAHFNLNVARATITAQLRAGRKGTRGEPAALNDGQADQLASIIE